MANDGSTAIAYFAYARPGHTEASLQALAANRGAANSPLYVFADAPRSAAHVEAVAQVRVILEGLDGFKSVELNYRKQNLGCAASIIDGVSQVLLEYDKVIVVEDDIVTAPYFLSFMNRALATFQGRYDVFSITGFNHPPAYMAVPAGYGQDVFLSRRACPWGWGTWADRWETVDWEVTDYEAFRLDRRARRAMRRGGDDLPGMLDQQMRGDIDSWAIRFQYAQFRRGAWTLWPVHSYVENIGHDGSGLHCAPTGRYRNDLGRALVNPTLPLRLAPNPAVLAAFNTAYRDPWLSRTLARVPGVKRGVLALKHRLGIDRKIL